MGSPTRFLWLDWPAKGRTRFEQASLAGTAASPGTSDSINQ